MDKPASVSAIVTKAAPLSGLLSLEFDKRERALQLALEVAEVETGDLRVEGILR